MSNNFITQKKVGGGVVKEKEKVHKDAVNLYYEPMSRTWQSNWTDESADNDK